MSTINICIRLVAASGTTLKQNNSNERKQVKCAIDSSITAFQYSPCTVSTSNEINCKYVCVIASRTLSLRKYVAFDLSHILFSPHILLYVMCEHAWRSQLSHDYKLVRRLERIELSTTLPCPAIKPTTRHPSQIWRLQYLVRCQFDTIYVLIFNYTPKMSPHKCQQHKKSEERMTKTMHNYVALMHKKQTA